MARSLEAVFTGGCSVLGTTVFSSPTVTDGGAPVTVRGAQLPGRPTRTVRPVSDDRRAGDRPATGRHRGRARPPGAGDPPGRPANGRQTVSVRLRRQDRSMSS